MKSRSNTLCRATVVLLATLAGCDSIQNTESQLKRADAQLAMGHYAAARSDLAAAAERGARFPLVEAGLAKADIRRLARHWELEVWDRPAMPCLSSRVPYGTPITVTMLSRIDRAEASLRARGFVDVRVRHYDDTARIELPVPDLGRALAEASAIDADLRALGYRYVTLDLGGLRSGNLNDALPT